MSIYQRIKDLREDSDKKQSELAQALSMQLTQYGRYERGERELPLGIAIQLAEYYNVSLDYIAGRTGEKNPGRTSRDPQEQELVRIFRQLSDFEKGQLYGTAKTLIESHK